MLKVQLEQAPVLANLDFSQEFILYMFASDVSLGVVLSHDFEGEEHPIVYLSRKLFP